MTRRRDLMVAVVAAAWPLGVLAATPAQLQVPAGPKRFIYDEETVYPIIATPGRITDIVLEPGEALVGEGAIAAGDTARWVIGDTVSGVGATRRVHVLVKPTAANLATNLLINTDRRTYHLELRASARTWLSQVAWVYPPPPIVLVAAPPTPANRPPTEPSERRINIGYKIEGTHPPWRPIRVFDDGRKVFVAFGPGIDVSDLPPLYRLGPDGKTAELINYRIEGQRLVTDRLFDRTELRLGAKRRAIAVRLTRKAKPQYVIQEPAP
ncbi:P-type conjugative transfer protein TrbG [Caulobacter sp. RHG1]|uniref:P-type conjugative transfer protein TrbG n=1 Tax=Caulobacter sp. (strain RHG1) TaxID=2545762 RepID=UPI001557E74E|nr:P-type conjugative transfer protein TrbG [Caulobacter sp. RHG1]NQE65350.1 Conjugative transfer protein TrbG [Caulobacter sp. RHG1]